jgi:hypothetical protein
MSLSRTLSAVALLAAALVQPTPSAAEDLLPPKVLVRKFPQGQFCALPVSITFTAPSSPVVVTFTALQFAEDGSGVLTFTDQAIDNVTLASSAQVAANFFGAPLGTNSQNCYNEDPVSYFYFNTPGLTLDLLELFDDDPSARGWHLLDGGVFLPGRSAPRDVGQDEIDETGGSLGLGDGAGPPVAGATASVSVTVSNLNPGQSYDLGAWWDAGFVRFPHDATYLTISVTTETGTPIATKSWGALKSSYR